MELMAACFEGQQRHGAPSSVLLVSLQISHEVSGKEDHGIKGGLGSSAELLEVSVCLEGIRKIAGWDKKLGV